MTGKQKRYLRALGHQLKPLVYIGKSGITPNVVKQVTDNLVAHELIKVKMQKISGPERKRIGERIAAASESTLVQVLGGMILLYKAHPKKPKISLPTSFKRVRSQAS